MSPAPRRPWRSAAAIAAGLLATAALSVGTDQLLRAAGAFPPPGAGASMSDGLFGVAAAYRIGYAALGGWLAAALAPVRPMRHAWILGGIGTALALAGAAATWARPDLGPRWYPLALVVTALPAVLAGGKLRELRPAPSAAT